MTLTNVGTIYYPPVFEGVGAPSTSTHMLLDAASEKAANVFCVTKTGTINKVSFRTFTVTTGATMDVRFETVDATNGNPSGTLWGTNTNVSHAIADTDDNLWLTTAAFTSGASVVCGDVAAVVIANPAASFGNLTLGAGYTWQRSGLPYGLLYTASWAKQTAPFFMTLQYDDGTIAKLPRLDGWSNITFLNATSASVYHGNKITLQFTCRVIGMYHFGNTSSSGTYTIKLFDVDGTTALGTISQDSDIKYLNNGMTCHIFSAPVTLKAGLTYWLAGASDGAATFRHYYADYGSTAERNASHPAGGAMCYSTATSPSGTGSWTDTTTRVLHMGLIIDQIDVSSGPLVGPGRLIRN